MINRVLIRIKVVQMLYSYLLTRSEFRIITSAGGDSRDQRYAHQLYLDTLLLILELSGCNVNNQKFMLPAGVAMPLRDSKMSRALIANSDIQSAIYSSDNTVSEFDSAVPSILRRIVDSSLYRSFVRRKNRDIPEEVEFWSTIVKTVIATDADFEKCARRNPDFTIAGRDLAMNMVVESLESYGDVRRLFREASSALLKSLDKAQELYYALMMLPLEITAMRDRQIDEARHKYLPSQADLNPSMRFVDNKFVAALSDSVELEEFLKEHPISWENDFTLIKHLLESVMVSKIYQDYMDAAVEPSFADDAELWRKLFRQVILPGDELAEVLENKSVYWNDDLEIVGDFVTKSIRKAATDGVVTLMAKYKDEEDERFGPDLFVGAVKNRDDVRELINRFLDKSSWDTERIAFMDSIIITVAITEMLNYPAIPIAVTMNEYVEIAKAYSTPNSGAFVNGILYSIANHLREQGKLLKQ